MFHLVVAATLLATNAAVLGGKIYDGRIVGGDETTIENFPHQISLRYLDEHTCGGSIINANTIITAAHCTNGKSVKYLEVRAGSSDIETGGQTVKIKEIAQHEQFDESTYDNDVSLLKLAEPLVLDNTKRPIELQELEILPNTVAIVSGWGYEEAGASEKPDKLRKVEVNVVDAKECNKDYDGKTTKAMLCANAPGKDACQGDSGGPLVAGGKLIGVVSWGEGCADFKHPGVYAKVSYLLPWIKSKLSL